MIDRLYLSRLVKQDTVILNVSAHGIEVFTAFKGDGAAIRTAGFDNWTDALKLFAPSPHVRVLVWHD